MKKLIFGAMLAGSLQAQVSFTFDSLQIDCHQAMIGMTVIDSGYTEGDFTLEYLDVIWQDCTLPEQIVLHPDTFSIFFSGMGEELQVFENFRIVYRHYPTATNWPVFYFSNPCITNSIEPVTSDKLITVQYFNLSGQPVLDPKGLCIELITNGNRQTWRKIYRN